jgi:hypothetical protein
MTLGVRLSMSITRHRHVDATVSGLDRIGLDRGRSRQRENIPPHQIEAGAMLGTLDGPIPNQALRQ